MNQHDNFLYLTSYSSYCFISFLFRLVVYPCERVDVFHYWFSIGIQYIYKHFFADKEHLRRQYFDRHDHLWKKYTAIFHLSNIIPVMTTREQYYTYHFMVLTIEMSP